MTLYRATYQAPKGRGCPHMTFVARDRVEAESIAIDWQTRSRVLLVKPIREIQKPLFKLEG